MLATRQEHSNEGNFRILGAGDFVDGDPVRDDGDDEDGVVDNFEMTHVCGLHLSSSGCCRYEWRHEP